MDLNNTTQILGVLSFGCSAVFCTLAWRRSGAGRGVWGALAALHALLALDVLLHLRHQATEALSTALASAGLYQGRGELQVMAIAFILGAVVLGVILFLTRRLASTGVSLRLAVCTTLCLIALFSVETISLHGVDKLFYNRVGPVFLIGWLWAAGAGVTAISAGLAPRRQPE